MPEANDGAEKAEFSDEDGAIASLNHSRSMLVFFAEQRLKNFNFFLVVSGIIVAVLARIGGPNSLPASGICLVSVSGLFLSIVFFLLDLRSLQQIKDARDDLELFEHRFGLRIHTVDQLPDPARGKTGASSRRGKRWLVSNTAGYRAVFFLVGLLSFSVLLANTPSFLDDFSTLQHRSQQEVECIKNVSSQ